MLFDQVSTLDTEMARNSRTIRAFVYYVAGVGWALAAGFGIACAAMLPLQRTELRFIAVEKTSGMTAEMVLAADAPATLFSEQQAKADLEKFITAVEWWSWDSKDILYHQAAIMSSAQQQAVFAAAMAPKNPKSPQVRYSNKTNVRVENFRSTLLGGSLAGTQIWQVRYLRTEIKDGAVGPAVDWQSVVTFSWRPELPVADERDRPKNLTGFQCTGYRSDPV